MFYIIRSHRGVHFPVILRKPKIEEFVGTQTSLRLSSLLMQRRKGQEICFFLCLS